MVSYMVRIERQMFRKKGRVCTNLFRLSQILGITKDFRISESLLLFHKSVEACSVSFRGLEQNALRHFVKWVYTAAFMFRQPVP